MLPIGLLAGASPATAYALPGTVGWGSDGVGELGNGLSGPYVSSPTPVSLGQRPADDTFAQLSAGSASACGVTDQGAGYCWGNGSRGALGNGSLANATTPVTVAQGARQPTERFTSIQVGREYACALTDASRAYCWGKNDVGQLGSGTFVDDSLPVAPTGSLTFRSLGVGPTTACGVATDDSVYCWGGIPNSSSPVRISGGALGSTRVASVAVGDSHACAVSLTGAAYCWGGNNQGQLGDGSTANSATPVSVVGALTLSAIVAGSGSTCGLSSGSVYCWGNNMFGQLGRTLPAGQWESTIPVLSNTSAVISGAVSAIALGGNTACARSQAGDLACWGAGSQGQVGNGSASSVVSLPVAVAGSWGFVTSGGTVTCGLLTAGDTYCWGERAAGLLGDGTATMVTTPVDTTRGEMGPTERLTTVEGGQNYACGVGSLGWVYCWGYGLSGRLGNNQTSNVWSPRAIASGSIPNGTTFTRVSAGYGSTCAVSSVGGLYCWGENNLGQLANGTTNQSSVPTTAVTGQKAADDTWLSVDAGSAFACGISSSRSLYCWGYASSGRLGNDVTSGSFDNPRSVSVPGPWKQVATGYSHACAIAMDDSTYCWGNNSAGQVGDGTTAQRARPTLINTSRLQAGEVFTQLAIDDSSCGLTSSGRILCWGPNALGQLGDGSLTSSLVPTPIATPLGSATAPTYVQVTFGSQFACGLAVSGAAYCWGINNLGQLGDGTLVNRKSPVPSVGGPYTALAAGTKSVTAIQLPPTLPAAPVLTSASTTQTTATISFTPGDDGRSPIGNYEYQLDGGAWIALTPADATSPISIGNLNPATNYTVSLRAVNGVGAGASSNTLNFTTLPTPPPPPIPVTPPGIPVGVTAAPGDSSATVRWSPPGELGTPPVVGYQVEATEGGVVCTTTRQTCTIDGLVNGREFAFRVRALSDSALGSWSAWTTPVKPGRVPSAPQSVVAVAGDDTALVAWQPSLDDGGAPIVSYTVSSAPGDAQCTVVTTSCVVTGLTNGTTYTFTVIATNPVGSSSASAPSNAVTPRSTVRPSIVITGSRPDRGPRDKVAIIGVTTGLVGAQAQAWVKSQGRSDFRRRGESVVISDSGRFRWTASIRRAAQVYFTAGELRSNTIAVRRR